ncbi:MAG: ornithine carbamoyltransferase [Candidatus Micrarchaeaceae archaeon]
MNLISSMDLSPAQIRRLFQLSDSLKDRSKRPLSRMRPILSLLFEKSSTRTRVSFESAMIQLGGDSIYLDARTSQIARGETIADTARVLSSYVDIIAARMGKQKDIEELARYSSVPVINALTDLEHPCQALSDIYTIRQAFGKVEGLHIAFVGDIATNTANSLMITAAKMGADVSLIGPDGCKPNMHYVNEAIKNSSLVEISNDLEGGLQGCDVVYTDTFVSMGEEGDAARRRKMFAKYQVNERVLKYAKKSARVMHCLPAHRGEEITSDVLDGKQSIVWQQAANKMLVEKAILLYLLNNEE